MSKRYRKHSISAQDIEGSRRQRVFAEALKKKSMDMQKLSELSGVSAYLITAHITGRVNLSRTEIQRLADLLDKTPTELGGHRYDSMTANEAWSVMQKKIDDKSEQKADANKGGETERCNEQTPCRTGEDNALGEGIEPEAQHSVDEEKSASNGLDSAKNDKIDKIAMLLRTFASREGVDEMYANVFTLLTDERNRR